jgi:cyclic pyranopterin phosphate synthase
MNERADKFARHQAELAKLEAENMVGISNECELSHVDESGKARMVDVGAKLSTERISEARGTVHMKEETLALIKTNMSKKGDVLATARIAGIMGAKSTSQLIPMCHPINLDNVGVELHLDEDRSTVEISAIVKTTSKTGVEMEAMTAVSVAALTVYDMCKSGDRGIRIGDIRLARKIGGKSGCIVLEE